MTKPRPDADASGGEGAASPRRPTVLLAALLVALVAGCAPGGDADEEAALPPCDPGNGGITLPAGFCAVVVADEVGRPRHIQVRGDGDIFVALRGSRDDGGGVLALRDTTGDGKADVSERWDGPGGTGIELRDGQLYFGADGMILRWALPAGALRPDGPPDTIVSGLPDTRSHRAKPIAFDDRGNLYVNVGSPSNSCQVDDRGVESPGRDPCPQLETRAGIWRFHADSAGQAFEEGERFATGLRNTVALEMHPTNGSLYGAVHGRDQLMQNWPDLFDAEYSAMNPAEEFVKIDEGDDFGWPYCYWSNEIDRKVLAPEYGGDGEEVGRCAGKEDPLLAFPGHWAPNGLLFYTGEQFPPRYRGGAFIAFHGSWNRAPLPQAGYNVVFVPFEGDRPADGYEVFAEGFPGIEDVQPRAAEHRPTGLAQGPDGSLYVTDDSGGRIWRIVHTGEEAPGPGGGEAGAGG